MSETSTCRYCDRPIFRLTQEESDAGTMALGLVDGTPVWWHTTNDGRLVRTCRAASYDPVAGWDDRWTSKRSPSAEPA